ncbi:MAG: FAD-dependent oxidoreductase, partial [Bacilli bacterium]
MMRDIIIIGSGVIGSFIARELSKYEVDVLVLEKENDVGNVSSMANSAIIHSGYDPEPGSLKAKFNVL